jgi:hypothetical protein
MFDISPGSLVLLLKDYSAGSREIREVPLPEGIRKATREAIDFLG